MKSRYLFLLPAAIMLASCAPRHTITADIEGWGETPVVIVYGDMVKMLDSEAGNIVFDTLTPVAGRLVFDIATEGPTRVEMISKSQIDRSAQGTMMPESSSINLILQPGEKVRIKGRQFDDYLDYSVRGSAGNEQWARHAEVLRSYTVPHDSVNLEIRKAVVNQTGNARDFLPTRDSLYRIINEQKRKFIVAHPASWLSGLYIVDGASGDSLKADLARLSPEVREGFLKPLLDKRWEGYLEYQAYLESQKVIKEGVSAPAFTLPDREGKAVSLADIDAEYVVLDFWGSWCGPCIQGFPEMKEYYAKYRSRVEFVGIACNDRQEDWIAALDKYTPGWTQLFDNPDDRVSVKYAVGAYPTKIVLGPDRKIIHIFVGEGEDFYKALDELLK